MEIRDFVARYPRLWHLAHGDAWPGIQQHGLLTATRLRELLGGPPPDRSTSRQVSVHLQHPELGSAVLRDQGPLDVAKLAPVLEDGLRVEDWLALLDGMTYFYPTEQGLRTLYGRYHDEPVTVVEVDSSSLVKEYELYLRLSSINGGATLRGARPRGRDTFLSLRRFGPAGRVPKEVGVEGGVPTLRDHLVSVERWMPDGSREVLR